LVAGELEGVAALGGQDVVARLQGARVRECDVALVGVVDEGAAEVEGGGEEGDGGHARLGGDGEGEELLAHVLDVDEQAGVVLLDEVGHELDEHLDVALGQDDAGAWLERELLEVVAGGRGFVGARNGHSLEKAVFFLISINQMEIVSYFYYF